MPFFLIRKPLNNLSKVSDEKGYHEIHPSSGKANKPHKGIDLKPGSGEGALDVFAAHDGKVVFSGQQIARDKNKQPILDENGKTKLAGYGNYIIVEAPAPDGRQTLYAHLATNLVQVGQLIGTDLGQVTKIGIAGTTGGSTGIHLHFEVILSDRKTRENPRPYLAEAFPDDFDKTVNAGKELSGELDGDFRDNALIGNSYQNTLVGLAGFDTYYQSFSGLDEIIDSDNDGKIIINTGSQNIILSGNALPKTGPLKEIIAGEWTLDGLNLFKVGEDLVVTKPGVKLSDFEGITNPKVPTITIKNFPFSNSRGGFGITLGKKADLSLGEDIFSKTLTNSYLPQGAFAVSSSDKGLFAPLAMLDSQGSELPFSHSIGVFDSFGNQLATHDVESVVKSSADSEMLTPDIGTGIKIGAGYSSGGYALFPISELGYIDGGSLQSRVGSHF